MTEEKNEAALFRIGGIYRDARGGLGVVSASGAAGQTGCGVGRAYVNSISGLGVGVIDLSTGRNIATSCPNLVPGECDAQGNPLIATPHHTASAEQQARNEAIRGAIEAVKVTKPTPAEVTKPVYTLHQHWSDKHGSGTCGVACGASLSRRWAR